MNCSACIGNRKWLDPVRVFVLVAALALTGCQTRPIMPPDREMEPANEVERISRELDKPKYAGIISAIDYHPADYPIRTTKGHKRFSDSLLKEYLDKFEQVGVLTRDNTINPVVAYEELGFEMEKTWCNNDVQYFISCARAAANQSSEEGSYSAFEEIAKYCLSKDNKTCRDMDNVKLLQQQ